MHFPYIEYLLRANGSLRGAQTFILYPGMEFASAEKWWPDRGMRPTPHEGIDFCYYLDAAGEERAVDPAFRVPVMASGTIVSLCSDYLGHSVFVDHGFRKEQRFLSVYAHIVPDRCIAKGQRLAPADVLGTIADTAGRKNRMPSHLHFTLMEVAEDVAITLFDWDLINRSTQSKLLDPLEMIGTSKLMRRSDNHWKNTILGGGTHGL